MKTRVKKYIFVLFLGAVLIGGNTVYSQCAMCRASSGSVKDNTKKTGAGLNKGILYLMSIPYVLGGIGGLVWWRKRKQIREFFNSTDSES